MEEQRKRRKNPTLALVLSAIFPGLGQVYNGDIFKGIIFILLNTVINFLLIDPLKRVFETGGNILDQPTLIIVSGYTIAGLVLWLYAIIDAKKTADRLNKKEEFQNL